MPDEGSIGYITNVESNRVLGVVNDDDTIFGTQVFMMQKLNDDNDGQKWKVGKKDGDGYFTITNPASKKVLTANSKDGLTITGM